MWVGVEGCPGHQKHFPATCRQRAATHTATAAWQRSCTTVSPIAGRADIVLILLPCFRAVMAEIVAESQQASGGMREAETELGRGEYGARRGGESNTH